MPTHIGVGVLVLSSFVLGVGVAWAVTQGVGWDSPQWQALEAIGTWATGAATAYLAWLAWEFSRRHRTEEASREAQEADRKASFVLARLSFTCKNLIRYLKSCRRDVADESLEIRERLHRATRTRAEQLREFSEGIPHLSHHVAMEIARLVAYLDRIATDSADMLHAYDRFLFDEVDSCWDSLQTGLSEAVVWTERLGIAVRAEAKIVRGRLNPETSERRD